MRGLFWLSDQQWAAIKPHLPYYAAGKGAVMLANGFGRPINLNRAKL